MNRHVFSIATKDISTRLFVFFAVLLAAFVAFGAVLARRVDVSDGDAVAEADGGSGAGGALDDDADAFVA